MNSVLTVSQLNTYISLRFKEDKNLRGKMIKGELSNFTCHFRTGHCYFTLKDENSSVRCVMFQNFAEQLNFVPENGMSVIVTANVQVYERDGVYQLYATDMQPSGLGALYLAYEQLKDRLSKEGLFDEKYKTPIPEYPRKIGVLTAKNGAALQDILKILSRRYPLAEVVLFPVIVQGTESADSICNAISAAQDTECDVLIVGRGGGSLEDLQSFNSENVARAVFSSRIPVISAVGHETDTTIIDFVSDLRAATPSVAAELAVPDKNELIKSLDMTSQLLEQRTIALIERRKKKFAEIDLKFAALSLPHQLTSVCERLNHLDELLHEKMSDIISRRQSDLLHLAAQLEAYNPMNVLLRGYSIAYHDGEILRSVEKLSSGDSVRIRLKNGEFVASVINITDYKE